MQLYSKHIVDPKVRRKTGALTVQGRAAIYMIFPADDLLASHVAALDYIVVSNLPLDPADEAVVLQKAAVLITRPNFGYDFAAYRDGLKYLTSIRADLDYLAIFNDSTWFPARPERNWMAEAEATGCDYVGSVFHCAMGREGKWDFRKDVWRTDPRFPTFHYGSYSLLIGKKVLTSPQFAQFWQDYRASNDKTKTIAHGCRGGVQPLCNAGQQPS